MTTRFSTTPSGEIPSTVIRRTASLDFVPNTARSGPDTANPGPITARRGPTTDCHGPITNRHGPTTGYIGRTMSSRSRITPRSGPVWTNNGQTFPHRLSGHLSTTVRPSFLHLRIQAAGTERKSGKAFLCVQCKLYHA
jgi:hypothetical protein